MPNLNADFISLVTLNDDGTMHAVWQGEPHGMGFAIAINSRKLTVQNHCNVQVALVWQGEDALTIEF